MKLFSLKLIGFLLFLLLASPVHAQFTILPSRDGRVVPEEKNLTYSLPRQTLGFQVEVRREVWEPGRFSEYAENLLGLTDVTQNSRTVYSLGRIRLHTASEPDPQHRYLLPRSPESRKGGEDIAVYADNGVLIYYGRSTFAPRQSHTHDHLHGDNGGWVSLSEKGPEVPMNAYSSRPDTVYKTIQRPDTLIRQAVVRQISASKSEEELAREMASRYFDLKEAQLRLLTGYQEVNYSDATLRYMYERLADQTEAYLKLFTGTQRIETRTYSYAVIPQLDRDSVWIPLFRFSNSKGAFPASGNQGDIVYVRWVGGKVLPARNKLPESGAIQPEETRSNLWYRIPVEASIELRMNNEILHQRTEHIAQLGLLQTLSYNKVSVEFDPHSGQLIRIIFDN